MNLFGRDFMLSQVKRKNRSAPNLAHPVAGLGPADGFDRQTIIRVPCHSSFHSVCAGLRAISLQPDSFSPLQFLARLFPRARHRLPPKPPPQAREKTASFWFSHLITAPGSPAWNGFARLLRRC